MKVCTIELDTTSDEKNYTIDTIHALKEMYPNDNLYYLMGMIRLWRLKMETS